MPEESTTLDPVRLARQGYEAMSRGDLDGVMSLFAADAVYLGHGVVLSVLREGGRLVGGQGRVEQRVAHLTTWTNGKIEWFKHYPDPDEARAAAERLAQERA